jgi:adenylate cyclase
VNAHASRPLVAIDYFHRAMRLSPLDPEKGIALSGIGMSYLMLERFEEALSWAEEALREMPGYGSSYRVAIGALVGRDRSHDGAVPDLLGLAAAADQSLARSGVCRALPSSLAARRRA